VPAVPHQEKERPEPRTCAAAANKGNKPPDEPEPKETADEYRKSICPGFACRNVPHACLRIGLWQRQLPDNCIDPGDDCLVEVPVTKTRQHDVLKDGVRESVCQYWLEAIADLDAYAPFVRRHQKKYPIVFTGVADTP
jgi:hypothetical protein